MVTNSKQPEFKKDSFICPYCGAFSHMVWENLYQEYREPDFNGYETTEFYSCRCISCGKLSLWEEFPTSVGYPRSGVGKMLYPSTISAPPPHPDLPEECLIDYSEARSIAQASPRGAAALLRLCIEKLCKELGGTGKNINADIANLVQKGLPIQIQQALDSVRVIGNEAVHPGTLTSDDHAEHVNTLFELVNFIVERMIAEPKRIAEIYEKLPEHKRKEIEKRDGKATQQP